MTILKLHIMTPNKSNVLLLFVLILFSSCSFVRLSHFEASDCKEACKKGLILKSIDGNKVSIIYGGSAHCCLKFKGKIKFKDDTLFLKAVKYENPCKCYCGYEFVYEIKGLKTDNYKITQIYDWGSKNKRLFRIQEELIALKKSDPLKYEKIRKRDDRKFDLKMERENRRSKRLKRNMNNRQNNNDDIYN